MREKRGQQAGAAALLSDFTPVKSNVVWSRLPFIRSGQNHLARHSEKGKKTRQTEEEVGRQHQGMDRPGVHQVTEANGEQETMEETGCEISCGAPTTLAVKEYMIMTSMGEIFSFLAIRKLMPVECVF